MHIHRTLILALVGATLLCFADLVESKAPRTTDPRIATTSDATISRDGGAGLRDARLRSAAAVDTTWLGYWDFDGPGACNTQGWTSVDLTAQPGTFFHVDDFAGMASPYAPLEGVQSMWCGARASTTDPITCNYAALPGYGNGWTQYFQTTACLNATGDVVIDYIARWDSEPGYDRTLVQYDLCDDNWQNVNNVIYDFVGAGTFSDVLDAANHSGDVRLRFNFSSDGAFSDEDGFVNGNGAFVLDSLTVSDALGTLLPLETFESEAVGDLVTTSGNWEAAVPAGFGDHAALFPGGDVLQEDGCTTNLSCMWGFFSGSTEDYGCGGHPEQAAVPYNHDGLYMRNEIWSPIIARAGAGESVVLQFDLYGDLPLDNLVDYVWHARSIVDGCADNWRGDNTLRWHEPKEWTRESFVLDKYLVPGAPQLQVAIGVWDACNWYCGFYGSGSCHSHSPLIDNISVFEVDYAGPEIFVYPSNLFSDAFPYDGTTTGTVRADAGQRSGQPGAQDFASIQVRDYIDGLAPDPLVSYLDAVYTYVTVKPDQPGKRGANLTDDSQYVVVDSLTLDGTTWYAFRMVPAGVDNYRIDLHDDLFTPGDTICYFFCAQADTPSSYVSYWSDLTGTTHDLLEVTSNPIEFTCLPTGAGDILYVDNAEGSGVQPFYDTAFDMMGLDGHVDRYDARDVQATNIQSTISSRLPNPAVQLSGYRKIIWDTGNEFIEPLAIPSSGHYYNDFELLHTFLANLDTTGGVYLAGNDLAAYWWDHSGDASAELLRNEYMSHTLVTDNHLDAGLGVSPLVIGEAGSCFDHGGDTDSLLAFGGCSMPPAFGEQVQFDVLSPTGSAVLEASYASGSPQGAIVSQRTMNPGGQDVGVILSGFSLAAIRDIEPDGVPARAEHLYDILIWLDNQPSQPVAAGPSPYRYALAQNYPNPFNPATTIRFSVAARTRVRVHVYNVAGQMVRSLVDRSVDPGVEHVVEWDGRNDAGQRVATGVYFYRMEAGEFRQTRKMVLLK